MIPTVSISSRGEERLRSGHPWIYRTDVADARAAAGEIVQVRSARGRTLGSALFSDRSQITLRMLAYGDEIADESLVRRRIEAALAFRQSLAIDATAYRLVHGDVDLRRGQKTGLFLDQRENRIAAAAYARGRMLDCFSYNGGFALVMGRRCDEVLAFDVSGEAIARVVQNAARNGVKVDARVGNV